MKSWQRQLCNRQSKTELVCTLSTATLPSNANECKWWAIPLFSFGDRYSIAVLFDIALSIIHFQLRDPWKKTKQVAVQEERGPRKHKPIIQSSHLFNVAKDSLFPSNLIAKSVPFSLEANQTLNFNVMAQILVACVKQAKLNEHFQQLPSQQQKIILKSVWTECFVLRASHWPIDIGPVIEQWVILLLLHTKTFGTKFLNKILNFEWIFNENSYSLV